MLTISNGWLSNSISYAQTIKAATAGQAFALDDMVDHSPAMGLGEKIVDYVFCGSVKKEFISHVYQMARKRAKLEITCRHNDHSADNWNASRMDSYHLQINVNEQRLKYLLSGKSLAFGTAPFENEACRDNYLIFRDDARRSVIGLPLNLQNPATRTTSQMIPIILIPTFDKAEQIELRDFANIKKSGKFICGTQTFDIRFTDDDEPVVMQVDENPYVRPVQRRLLNLWAIENLKKRLAEFESLSGEDVILCVPFFPRGEWPTDTAYRTLKEWQRVVGVKGITDRLYPQFTNWDQFAGVIQEKIFKAVETQTVKLNQESSVLAQELERYAKLIKPTVTEQRGFLTLQQKINQLVDTRKNMKKYVRYFNEALDAMCKIFQPDFEPAMIEAFKRRMLNFTKLMGRFIRSEPTHVRAEKFKALCQAQSDWNAKFPDVQSCGLLTPPQFKTWNYPLHPPVSQARKDGLYDGEHILLRDVQDPTVTWESFERAMRMLKEEQDARIERRKCQFKMADELGAGILMWCRDRYPVQQPRPVDFSRYIIFLEQIRDELLTPGNDYNQQELNGISSRITAHFTVIRDEYARLNPQNLAAQN